MVWRGDSTLKNKRGCRLLSPSVYGETSKLCSCQRPRNIQRTMRKMFGAISKAPLANKSLREAKFTSISSGFGEGPGRGGATNSPECRYQLRRGANEARTNLLTGVRRGGPRQQASRPRSHHLSDVVTATSDSNPQRRAAGVRGRLCRRFGVWSLRVM